MESITKRSFLMMKETAEYEKLVDIKDYPDIGGTPEQVEVTTLSDEARRHLPGIEERETLEFSANYTAEDYQRLLALKDQVKEFAVWFGGENAAGKTTPTGVDGKFSFSGMLTVRVTGGGINEPRQMSVSIFSTTDVTFSIGS